MTGSHVQVHTVEELVDRAAKELEGGLADFPAERAAMHFRLGRTYWGLGRARKMREQIDRALALYRESRPPGHADTLLTLPWAALAREMTDQDVEEIEALYREAIEGLEREPGKEDPQTIMVSVWRAWGLLNSLDKSDHAIENS